MAISESLLTAEQYRLMPDNGRPTELVRGRIIEMNMPGARHGWLCSRLARLLGNFAERHDLGYVLCNDSGVVTEQDPDTVRGADVSFYSYARLPKGTLSDRYPKAPPELVFEVLSPGNKWKEVLAKVAEYLNVGVLIVCVVDSTRENVVVYAPDQPPETLIAGQELVFPFLPGFTLPVADLFA